MARYFSVDEAAQILSTTDRTVRRMLSSGRLAGSQHMDKGKLVWRVHASKEILEKVSASETQACESDVIDIVDATEENSELNFEPDLGARTWQAEAQSQAGNIAEQFWNQVASKFMERIEIKDQVIGSLRHEIEEKDRQLRLLPDLEKRAEEERRSAELKSLETEALRKQITALEQEKLRAIEDERHAATEAMSAEIERLRLQKEAEDKVLKEELTTLKKKLEKLEQPWWKKWLSTDQG